ncbi:hypothetical protein LZ31DRAFT_356124 [Colletotrichum somersetense]|nr:hypothetical protein LZ31DRAFT_356124 [Colletotrichum somersetense]
MGLRYLTVVHVSPPPPPQRNELYTTAGGRVERKLSLPSLSPSSLDADFSVARSDATASPHRHAGDAGRTNGGCDVVGRGVHIVGFQGFVSLPVHLLLLLSRPSYSPSSSYVPRSGPPLWTPFVIRKRPLTLYLPNLRVVLLFHIHAHARTRTHKNRKKSRVFRMPLACPLYQVGGGPRRSSYPPHECNGALPSSSTASSFSINNNHPHPPSQVKAVKDSLSMRRMSLLSK